MPLTIGSADSIEWMVLHNTEGKTEAELYDVWLRLRRSFQTINPAQEIPEQAELNDESGVESAAGMDDAARTSGELTPQDNTDDAALEKELFSPSTAQTQAPEPLHVQPILESSPPNSADLSGANTPTFQSRRTIPLKLTTDTSPKPAAFRPIETPPPKKKSVSGWDVFLQFCINFPSVLFDFETEWMCVLKLSTASKNVKVVFTFVKHSMLCTWAKYHNRPIMQGLQGVDLIHKPFCALLPKIDFTLLDTTANSEHTIQYNLKAISAMVSCGKYVLEQRKKDDEAAFEYNRRRGFPIPEEAQFTFQPGLFQVHDQDVAEMLLRHSNVFDEDLSFAFFPVDQQRNNAFRSFLLNSVVTDNTESIQCNSHELYLDLHLKTSNFAKWPALIADAFSKMPCIEHVKITIKDGQNAQSDTLTWMSLGFPVKYFKQLLSLTVIVEEDSTCMLICELTTTDRGRLSYLELQGVNVTMSREVRCQ